MKLKHYRDGWFLTSKGFANIGPFETKAEADDEWRELLRAYGSEAAIFGSGEETTAGPVSDVGSSEQPGY
jgi:hypothetical protein